MILTSRNELSLYQNLCGNFQDAIKWAEQADWDSLAEGNHSIDGDRIFLIHEVVALKPLCPESVWEAHNRYIDILLILSGAERLGWAPRSSDLPIRTAYDEQTDKILFDAAEFDGSYVDVRAGQAVIFLPCDAHVPCLPIDGPKSVRRAVFKVQVEE